MEGQMINETLALYGAKLGENNFIVKGGKETGVRLTIAKRRIRFEGSLLCGESSLLSSGPVEPSTIESFVEKFWYWRKLSDKD